MNGKKDYKASGIFYGLFIAPKIKYCLTIDKFSIVQENKTIEGFNDSKRLLDRSQYFQIIECKKVSALLPKNWKKSIDSGTFIRTKMRFCNECIFQNCAIKVKIKSRKVKNSKLIQISKKRSS